MALDDWEAVIGMEVHAQLSTRSKMFCPCTADYLGAPPNSNVCPVCMGMPGSLPVVNGRAVEQVVKTALALGCEVARQTKFDRKNYFYPDLPKGYQISQYDLPMAVKGRLEVDGHEVRITRVHLEEDTGKLVHAGDGSQIIHFPGAGVDQVRFVRIHEQEILIVGQPCWTVAVIRQEFEFFIGNGVRGDALIFP